MSETKEHGSGVLLAAANRRRLLRGAGLGTLAAALTSLPGGGSKLLGGGSAFAQSAPTDTDILNFALNLEYLEAQYYLHAVYGGSGLPSSDTGGTGTAGGVTGGSPVPFPLQTFSNSQPRSPPTNMRHDVPAYHPRQQRGGQPAIDLQQSFTTAAVAAGIIQAGQTFNPFENEQSFLLGAFIFEDVGVTAYHGAAPLISGKAYFAAAAAFSRWKPTTRRHLYRIIRDGSFRSCRPDLSRARGVIRCE